MPESTEDKAELTADDIMTCNGVEQSSTKHLTMANNSDTFTKKKEKENYSDAKLHNLTECCRWVMWHYTVFSSLSCKVNHNFFVMGNVCSF